MVRLRDTKAPRVTFAGQIAVGQTVRGTRSATIAATDVGAGVRRTFLAVNGRPMAARDLGCELARGIALRLAPCPRQVRTSFAANTAGDAFRQGLNVLRACALDFADHADANSRCVTRRVRVDNDCPVDGSGVAARIQAHLRRPRPSRGGSAGDGRPTIHGRLVNDGEPVAGARVCVAGTPHVDGARERVLATPTTNVQGSFAARLPARPSRDIRVAYWADDEHVSERYLHLRVPVRPRLRARPRSTLHNGERARFRVDLPEPAAQRRRVSLQALADGRWLRIRAGRTNAQGIWRSSYRFHATTGTRTYRFRASVPHQRGYPYRGGRSGIARVTVEG
jgi:hypothetical protein